MWCVLSNTTYRIMVAKRRGPFALWLVWALIVALILVYAKEVAANLVWVKGAPLAWWVFVCVAMAAVTTGAVASTIAWWKKRMH